MVSFCPLYVVQCPDFPHIGTGIRVPAPTWHTAHMLDHTDHAAEAHSSCSLQGAAEWCVFIIEFIFRLQLTSEPSQ